MQNEPNEGADQLEPATNPTTSTRSSTIDEALERFPDSSEAVDLIATCLKLALASVPDEAEDTRHERIRAAIAGVSSDVRTRAGVVCTVLSRVAGELKGLVLVVKDEQGDADILAGDAVILPEGWLVVMMAGTEIARVPFDPRRPDAEGVASDLANQMLTEYVTLHVQGKAAAAAAVGESLRTDTGPLTTRRLPGGEAVVAARTILKASEAAQLATEGES
jgi:hypothetical protein